MVFRLITFTYLWVNVFLSSKIKEAIDMVKIQAFWNATSCLLVNCLLGLLVPEDDGTRTLRSVGNYVPNDMVPYIRRLELQQHRREQLQTLMYFGIIFELSDIQACTQFFFVCILTIYCNLCICFVRM